MSFSIKTAAKAVCIIVVSVVALIGVYVAYMYATYNRIEDNTQLEVRNNTAVKAKTGKDYTALTYNIGFGAYTANYTFFMDEGCMKDGTKTQGTHSWAVSKDSCLNCIEEDIELIKEQVADIVMLQEVDSPSTRSHDIDQVGLFEGAFIDKAMVSAVDFHSSFMFYPLTEPHGFANSSLVTLSSLQIDSATRRSYPVADNITKFFDLDRCFSVSRIPVENGRELVVANSHMSAYDEGGVIRAAQLQMLKSFLSDEAAKGNYVILGGDFNHALCGSEELYPSQQVVPDWVSTLSDADLPEGFSIVKADNLADVATCRGADIPYEKGKTYETTVDGFIVSSNVKATAVNVDNGYRYSDHNPVKLTFTLKD